MSPSLPRYASHHFVSAVAVSLSLLGSLPVTASTLTWNGTSTDFESGANWGGTSPTSDLASAVGVFTGSVTANAPTITVSRSISGLDFESAGWTLGGNTGTVLTLGTSGVVSKGAGVNTIGANVALGAAQTWNIASGNTLSLSGSLGGTSAVTITGGGLLSLANPLAFNGQMTVASGTVNALAGGTFGSVGNTASLTINSGGTVTAAGVLSFGGGSSTTGTLNMNGGLLSMTSGSLVIGTSSGMGILNMTSGTISVTDLWGRGGTNSVFNISGGTLIVSRVMNVTGAVTIGDGVGTPAVLSISGTVTPNSNAWTSGITINADGTLTVDNTAAARSDRLYDQQVITLNGGAMNYLGGNATIFDLYSTLSLNQGSSTLTMTPYATAKTAISATAGLSRSAGTTLLVRGVNLGVSGTATVNTTHALFANGLSQLVGTVTDGTGVTNLGIIPYMVGDSTATGQGSGFVTYSSTNGLRLLSSNEYTSLVSTSATDSNVKLSSTDTLSTSGTINSLVLNGGVLKGSSTALTINSGALLAVGAGNQITTGTLSFGSREGIITTNGALTISSVVAGSNGTNGLTKSGTGTLTLTGVNTYTGATTINQGVISIGADSALGASGGIVFSSGTLATTASGTTSRAISINNSGATFAPAAGTQWTIGTAITGTGGLTVNGLGTLLLGASNSYAGATSVLSGTLQLGASQTASNISVGGGSGSGTLDVSAYKLTMSTGQLLTINSGGTLVLSNTASGNSSGVYGDIAVYGGTIQITNNISSNAANTLAGNVTLYSGGVLSSNASTADGAAGYLGRIAFTGNFTAYAGSTIASNENGFLTFNGSSVYIDAGVTLAKGVIAGRTATNMLTFARSSGTQTLTSYSALDAVFVRDLNTSANSSTMIMNVGAISGGNIGQLYVNNIDPGTTTTVQLANNLTVIAGKGILNQNPGSVSTAAVAFDLNGYTYDGSAASSGWAPNTSGSTNSSPWQILSSSGTGTFRASYFTLTGTSTDVTIGNNVVLEATASGNTTDLGIKTGGTGTISASSTFLFEAGGNHYLKSSNGRSVGNLLVGDAATSSTVSLSSDLTTGAGSSVTVKDGSELATRWYNLTTTGAVNIGDAQITGDGTGSFSVAGTITATGTGNAAISAPIALAGSGNQEIAVGNASANLTISGGISGAGKGLTKTGAGTATFTGASSYTGATVVDSGLLTVNGSIASSSQVNIHSGASLSGSGTVGAVSVGAGGTLKGTLVAGAISGSGLVAPGNSPGILTATSVQGGTGLSFAFELLQAGSPNYASATASGNDLLHLTGATPFDGALTAGNTISVYLASETIGSTYLGGFFADNLTAELLKSAVENASFAYYVLDTDGNTSGDLEYNGNYYTSLNSSLSVSVSAVSVTNAAFATGVASGSELEFTVVPEPSTWALILGGCGMLALGQRRRWQA